MPTLEFFVEGKPIGKPRQTHSDRWKKRPVVLRWYAWKDKCTEAFQAAGGLPENSIIDDIMMTAHFCPAKSLSKKKKFALLGQPHRQRPDIDNIAKALLDAVFLEDSHVSDATLRKRWNHTPGLHVEIDYHVGSD